MKHGSQEKDGRGSTPAGNSKGRGGSQAAEAPARDSPFRSWVTDRANCYERLTDEKGRQIVLKFAGQPSEDIRAKLKEAGFRFQPEYFGQQKVWTRRNDFEGRLQVEQLESAIRGPASEPPRELRFFA